MPSADQAVDTPSALHALANDVHVDQPSFRNAMARIGAAVHVVTTDGPFGKTGFTATAIVSVSDSPPTILGCVFRNAGSIGLIRRNGRFCVNTLRAGQESISNTFAGRTKAVREDRFDHADWFGLPSGSQALRSAIVALDCRLIEVKPVASHDVFFGRVETIHFGEPGPALIYHDRAYKQL